MLPLLLALICCDPSPPPKVFKFGVSLELDKDCKITIEMPCPDVKPSHKTLTVEEFKRNAKGIIYQDYKLQKIKVDGLKIQELHFRLMQPSDERPPPGKEEVRANPAKP